MKKNKKQYNKSLIICISTFLIVSIIVYFFINYNSKDFKNIKQEKSNYLVYTKETKQSGNYIQKIPYINIKGENISIINNDINNYLSNFKNNNTSIDYEYSINGIVLSIIIKVEDHSIEVATTPYFRSYNINLNTSELLSNEAILNELNITEEEVKNKINEKLKYYYKDISKKEYFDVRECDYECFLMNREIDKNDLLNNCEYFIRSGKLVVFKPYIFASFYGEEEYFNSENYEFIIN